MIRAAWRELGAGAAIAALALGCGRAPAKTPEPTGPPLHLDPISDLVPAAGLRWMVDVRPRALWALPELVPPLERLLAPERMRGFASRNGGVNPSELEEIVFASYASTSLIVTRGAFDPSRVEAAFRAQSETLDGRAIDRVAGSGSILRMWGTMHAERAQMAMLGHDAIGLELGRFGPLRAAELFAEERLKRASPALRAVPLTKAAELLQRSGNDAPMRAFAPGPFEGDAARALAGLLGASTAAALAIRYVRKPDTTDRTAALEATLVLTGGWQADAPAAAEKLRAALDTLGATPMGRLISLDHPLGEPRVEALPDALRVTLLLDAMSVMRGLKAAFGDAEISEIMSY